MRDAVSYQQSEQIPWTVLVDDLRGTVHQAYGGLAAPTYLIDVDGRVAFYNVWTHAPTLHVAIEALMRQHGRGIVKRGIDRVPHLLASVADGWRAIQRGLPQSVADLMLALPGAPAVLWTGQQARPALAPVALRARPLPVPARAALAGVAALALALAVRRRQRPRQYAPRDSLAEARG